MTGAGRRQPSPSQGWTVSGAQGSGSAHQPRPRPRIQSQVAAGVVAGLAAGLVMAVGMMAYQYAQGNSIWSNPNLIAVMWMGREVANGELSRATPVGFLTHMATSGLMGWIAIPFVRDLPPWRTLLVALAYSLASYPLVFALVLSWANPLMVERTALIPMTTGHILFGVVLGTVFLWLHPSGPAAAKTG